MKKRNEFEASGWQIHTSKDIYENPWIHVREDQVTTPGGEKGIYGVIHFKNAAVAILPIDDDGFTWLVGQYRYPLDIYSWELPMGGALIGTEDFLDAAKRELEEETGLTANEWSFLMTMHTSNSVTDEVAHVYVAKNLSLGNSKPEHTELLSTKKVHLNEVLEQIKNGTITDAITIAAILRYIS